MDSAWNVARLVVEPAGQFLPLRPPFLTLLADPWHKILPWDWDIDTQVSGQTLAYMALYLNYTVYKYTATIPLLNRAKGTRRYLLDVNPYAHDRTHGDGMNVIDARWIDTRNGLYIDITGVSELPFKQRPGVWSCKNEHEYRVRDLFPLREGWFEGMKATVPNNYAGILVEEYGHEALVRTEFEHHSWDVANGSWARKDIKWQV